MGLPVSPVIGNIYKGYLKEIALAPECPMPTPWWKRNIDDIISTVKKTMMITSIL